MSDRGSTPDRGRECFLHHRALTESGAHQPPIQCVMGALSLGVERLLREANHALLFSAEVKNAWSFTSTLQYVFMAWCLIKLRDEIVLTVID